MTPEQSLFLQTLADHLVTTLMTRMVRAFPDDMDAALCAVLVAESVASATQHLAREDGCPSQQIADMVRLGHVTGKDVARVFELNIEKQQANIALAATMPPGEA